MAGAIQNDAGDASTIAERGLAQWHRTLKHLSPEALDAILDDEVVFHSPVVHTPQAGRDLTRLYLLAAFNVFPGDPGAEAAHSGGPSGGHFRYVREVVGERDAVLEFETQMDGIHVNGVDMIRWNEEGRIVDFKVLVRPLKAIQKVHAQMGAMLQQLKDSRAG